MKNKAWKLFDEKFVKELLAEKVLPIYPDFSAIKKVRILPHKDDVWLTTYHVVLEYRVRFIGRDGKCRTLPIFCSAHSGEPRRNVHEALSYLWNNGFGRGYATIPRPLFYSEYFRATFYRGAEGRTLRHYIRKGDRAAVGDLIPKAAKWFAKLHRLPTVKAPAFNRRNSRIRTVVPGSECILDKIKKNYPKQHSDYERIYAILISREEETLKKLKRRYLVHGDAHPDNIVKMGKKKLALIDYTDICQSDFARDLGTFTQQLDYMLMRNLRSRKFCREMSDLFLATYFSERKIEMDEDLAARIRTYYLWTMMRTATHFLIKASPCPYRAWPLLKRVKAELLVGKK